MGLFAGTRPDNLGVRDGRLAPCPPTPNCVSSQAESKADPGHYVAPLAYRGDGDRAWTAFEAVVAASPRATIVTSRPGYLHAEFRSALLGFVDDFEALSDEPAKVIQVRSASRLGYSDLGVNRNRVEELRKRFAAGNP